jgi:hypothetical protein
MSQTEQDLRELFASQASGAPTADGLADGALVKVRRRRSVQRGVLGGVGVLALAGVMLVSWTRADAPTLPGGPTPVAQGSSPSSTSTPGSLNPFAPQGSPTAGPAVGISGDAQSCAVEYSPAEVSLRAFAFDGTVVSIGAPLSNRAGSGVLPLAGVTFHVNDWFKGGSGDTVTVDMNQPSQAGNTGSSSSENGLGYAVGTRLLVSGEPRWGGAPLDAAIAWTCGFTREYSPPVAAQWAQATR